MFVMVWHSSEVCVCVSVSDLSTIEMLANKHRLLTERVQNNEDLRSTARLCAELYPHLFFCAVLP